MSINVGVIDATIRLIDYFTPALEVIEKHMDAFAADMELEGKRIEAANARIATSFEAMSFSFRGERIGEQAAAVVMALDNIGGKAFLTAAELKRVNLILDEAVIKSRMMGGVVPENLQFHAADMAYAAEVAAASAAYEKQWLDAYATVAIMEKELGIIRTKAERDYAVTVKIATDAYEKQWLDAYASVAIIEKEQELVRTKAERDYAVTIKIATDAYEKQWLDAYATAAAMDKEIEVQAQRNARSYAAWWTAALNEVDAQRVESAAIQDGVNKAYVRDQLAAIALSKGVAKAYAEDATAYANATNVKVKSLQDWSNQYRNASRDMIQVGQTMTMYVTAPLLLIGGLAIKSATDFEQAAVKLVTLSGVTASAANAMKEGVLAMSTEVGVKANDLMTALLQVTSTGIRDTTTALQILEMAAKGSAVGLGSTEEVAKSITSVLMAYGKENITASQATNILYKTVVEGKGELTEFAGAMGRVVGLAASVGVSFDEVGTYLAAYTRLGVSASEATTALRSTLQRLELKDTKPMNDALALIGTNVMGLRKEVSDHGLILSLIKLREEFDKIGRIDALEKVIPNIRGFAGVLAVTGAQAKDVVGILLHLSNGVEELNGAFMLTSETAAFKWSQLTAEFQRTAIVLGNALLPSFIKLMPALQDMLLGVVGLIEKFQALPVPVKWVLEIFAEILIAAGPLLIFFGSLARVVSLVIDVMILLGLKTGITTAATIANTAAVVLNTAALTVQAGVVTVAATGVSRYAAMAVGAGTATQGWTIAAGYGTAATWGLGAAVSSLISGLGLLAAAWWTATAAGRYYETASDEDKLFMQGMSKVPNAKEVSRLLTATREASSGKLDRPLDAFGKIGGVNFGMQDTTQIASMNQQYGINSDYWERQLQALNDRGKVQFGKEGGGNGAGGELTGTINGIDSALYKLNSTLDLSAPKFKMLGDTLVSVAKDGQTSLMPFFGFASDGIDDMMNRLGPGFQKLREKVEAIESGANSAGDAIYAMGTKLPDEIFVEWPSLTKNMKKGLMDVLSGFPQLLQSALTGGGGIGGALQAVGSQVGSILGQAGFGALANSMTGMLGKLGPKVGGAIFDMIPGIGGAIGALVAPAIEWIGNKLFKTEGKKVNDLRDAYFEAAGGYKKLEENLRAAGADSVWDTLWTTGKIEEWEAAVLAANKALDAMKVKQEAILKLQGDIASTQAEIADLEAKLVPEWDKSSASKNLLEVIGRYKLDVDALGSSIKKIQLNWEAEGIISDWDMMARAGSEMGIVAGGMADQVNLLVQGYVKAGIAIPGNMKPILQKMLELGLLTDAAGKKLNSLDDLGFGADVKTEADKIKDAILELTDKLNDFIDRLAVLMGLKIDIPINLYTPQIPELPNLPQPGGGGSGPRGDGEDYTSGGGGPRNGGAQAFGGDYWVTKPTLFLAGEAGPERATFTPAGKAGAASTNINITIQALDPVGLRRVVEQEVAPMLVSAYRRNANGLRTKTRRELVDE